MLIPMHSVVAMCGKPITGVIHAGAHLGEEAAWYHTAKISDVLWIEGNPGLIDELTRRVERYGSGHRVVNTLVGASSGEAVLHVANNGQSSSVLPFGTHSEKHPEVHFTGDVVVGMRTIDDVAEENGAVGYNFMNLDLQGYELEALKGATRVLELTDYVYTEVNVDELYIGCARLGELDEFLEGFERVSTSMAGATGWGDALYCRTGS